QQFILDPISNNSLFSDDDLYRFNVVATATNSSSTDTTTNITTDELTVESFHNIPIIMNLNSNNHNDDENCNFCGLPIIAVCNCRNEIPNFQIQQQFWQSNGNEFILAEENINNNINEFYDPIPEALEINWDTWQYQYQ